MRRILVPVDGSEGSAHAARFAADIARGMASKITLVHAYDASATEVMGLPAMAVADLDRARSEVAQASFRLAKEAMGATEPEACEVPIGDPAQQILKVAEEGEFDLIVMGHRGRSRVAELMLGSVSERVVRGAHCPVTIVR